MMKWPNDVLEKKKKCIKDTERADQQLMHLMFILFVVLMRFFVSSVVYFRPTGLSSPLHFIVNLFTH